MTVWYAVGGRGQGNVFTSCPERDKHFKVWRGHIEGCISSVVCLMEAEGDVTLPVMTWDDEPIALDLTLKIDNG